MVKNDNSNPSLVYKYRQNLYYLFPLIILLLLKAVFFYGVGPLPDEAYYWLWSKNPAYSYYDHPPLSVWLQSLISSFISNKQIQIRIVPLISFVIIFFLNLKWMDLIGRDSTLDKIKGSLLFVSIPLYSVFLTISFPDALLILLIYISGFYFYKFIQFSSGKKIRYVYWYLSIAAFSLACITKYNAIFFGIGIFVFLVIEKKYRKILLSRHLFFGLFIMVLLQIPVVFWNVQNEYASFNFHLNSRLEFSLSTWSFALNFITFLVAIIIAISPILFFGILNKANITLSKDLNRTFLNICYLVCFCTLIICLILSIFTSVLYYWATTAFILFFPILTYIITKKSYVLLNFFYGFLIISLLLINSSIYPVSSFWGKVDRETGILYGWNNITDILNDLKAKNNVNQVIFTDYRLASLYSFYSGDHHSDAIMENRDTQFDIWRKGKNIKANKVFIISDDDFPIHKKISQEYLKIVYLRPIDIYNRGKKIKTYRVYLGKM